MKQVSREQRRARLALRHHLADPGSGPLEVISSLVAVHSTDPVTVYLSVWARVDGFRVEDLEELLYVRRSVVRHWAMRRTLWVVARETLPEIVASSTRAIGERERRRTVRLIEEGGVAEDGEAWLRAHLPGTVEKIRAEGEVLARQLSNHFPELAKKITFYNKAGKVAGTTGMSSRALVQLGLESTVVRGRPTGSWVSGQYRWALMEDWLGAPLPEMTVEEASASLLRKWLRSYGPATEKDMRWWTGWPLGQVRRAVADIGAVEVSLEGDGVGFALSDDLEDVLRPEPWVALLPSLDTTTMGWKERDWYLGEHHERLFDRNGNAGPTVWVDGRVAGGWAQRADGEIVYGLLDDVGSDSVAMVDRCRDRLQEWLGQVRFTPRFRSPHETMLTQ